MWFPNWPIQRLCSARPELEREAVIVHGSPESRSPLVTACSRHAVRRHVRPGMPLAEARALAPRGWFALADPAADRAHLRQLAWQCQRFTPLAGVEPAAEPESLFLDVTGCTVHFQGLPALCQEVTTHFQQQGYQLRLAAAPTFGAAWAVAHVSAARRTRSAPNPSHIAILDHNQLRETLNAFPVSSLRLPGDMLMLLAECGLRTIGQLAGLPRSSLPSRFGPLLLLRLDQAWGDVEELLQPDLPTQPIRSEQRFEEPLQESAAVLFCLRELLSQTLSCLQSQDLQTQQLVIHWRLEGETEGGCEIRLLRPTSAAGKLWELLSLRCEGLQLPAGMLSLTVEAIPCPREVISRSLLFDAADHRESAFLNLVERLSSRLGEQSVVRTRLIPEYQPELAWRAESWLMATSGSPASSAPLIRGRRPLCLCETPERIVVAVDHASGRPRRFRWRQGDHTVAICEGPERIETGWWRSAGARRDYYRIETSQGGRFWIFQQLAAAQCAAGAWFLHGVFE